MATHTSTIPAVLDALKALLDARATTALDGVEVWTAPSGDPIPHECIQFFGTDGDQQWAALGNRRRRETYTITGAIFIIRLGAGQDKAKEARDRAYAILAELEDALRVAPTLGLPDRVEVQLATNNLDQGPQDNGRYAAIPFTLAVTAELVSN